MPFRLWFYLAKIGGGVLLAIVALSFFFSSDGVFGRIRFIALCLLIPLCLVGVYLGILMSFGRLRMSCPFCGKPGRAGGSKAQGMWMECDSCGFIHGSGPFRLKIVREEMAHYAG
jgi:predicted RNA-binding Zn-ribbon protein involved in translation (DUF1610 family)